jgi:hypothetical protein
MCNFSYKTGTFFCLFVFPMITHVLYYSKATNSSSFLQTSTEVQFNWLFKTKNRFKAEVNSIPKQYISILALKELKYENISCLWRLLMWLVEHNFKPHQITQPLTFVLMREERAESRDGTSQPPLPTAMKHIKCVWIKCTQKRGNFKFKVQFSNHQHISKLYT